MHLHALAAATYPYEQTNGWVRGFSHDIRFEYEARVVDDTAPAIVDLCVIRTGSSWSTPIARYGTGGWTVRPRDPSIRRFVRLLSCALSCTLPGI